MTTTTSVAMISTPPVLALSAISPAPTSTNDSTVLTLPLENNAAGHQQSNSFNTEGNTASGHQSFTQSTSNQMDH